MLKGSFDIEIGRHHVVNSPFWTVHICACVSTCHSSRNPSWFMYGLLSLILQPLPSNGIPTDCTAETKNRSRISKDRMDHSRCTRNIPKLTHSIETNIRRPCLALAKAGRRLGPPWVWSFAFGAASAAAAPARPRGTPLKLPQPSSHTAFSRVH